MDRHDFPIGHGDLCVIEQVSNYGGQMGDTLLDTVFWSGRFAQVLLKKGASVRRMKRKSIVTALTGLATSRDKHVRAALIYRFGGDPSSKKKNDIPEMLKGMRDDDWSALATAVAAGENLSKRNGDRLSEC